MSYIYHLFVKRKKHVSHGRTSSYNCYLLKLAFYYLFKIFELFKILDLRIT